MPQYIEKEPLLGKAKELQGGSFATPLIIESIENAPAIDVVPRSEFDALKELLDATTAGQETLQKALVDARGEVAREIFEEIDEILFDYQNTVIYRKLEIESRFTELKKKYTEDKTDG